MTGLCFCQGLEKLLDVFNITLARQQAQMEVKSWRRRRRRIIKLSFSCSSLGDQVRTESGVKKAIRGTEAGTRRILWQLLWQKD